MNVLLSLGHGYTAQTLARRLIPLGWQVIGTTRARERAAELRILGVEPLLWPKDPSEVELAPALRRATHILASAAPEGGGDPFLATHGVMLAAARPAWVGYLSTTAVYGDHQGAWVDETTPLAPVAARARHRVLAEQQWLATGLPMHIFRLAGIYGPGRGPFEKVREGTARRIIKPGQVFSRIHVDDIATTLLASITHPRPGRIYNLCDDDPAPPQDVLSYAATLLGMPEPPAISYADAEMTPMARSFYADSKRVRNDRIKTELGVTLRYPDYRACLRAMLAAESPSKPH